MFLALIGLCLPQAVAAFPVSAHTILAFSLLPLVEAGKCQAVIEYCTVFWCVVMALISYGMVQFYLYFWCTFLECPEPDPWDGDDRRLFLSVRNRTEFGTGPMG